MSDLWRNGPEKRKAFLREAYVLNTQPLRVETYNSPVVLPPAHEPSSLFPRCKTFHRVMCTITVCTVHFMYFWKQQRFLFELLLHAASPIRHYVFTSDPELACKSYILSPSFRFFGLPPPLQLRKARPYILPSSTPVFPFSSSPSRKGSTPFLILLSSHSIHNGG